MGTNEKKEQESKTYRQLSNGVEISCTMKRRATTAHAGVDKGIPQKVVKQALEIKRAGPYLIGKFHQVYFAVDLERKYQNSDSTNTRTF